VARMAGWLPEGTEVIHVAFGLVLAPDRKRLRSRSGGTVKLNDLLTEAVERAEAALGERTAGLSAAQRASLARAVGVGAVKYADLSTERTRDYVFDWDRMLASDGNTGPYLQYAHARIRSIFRRSELAPPPASTPVRLDQAEERALALALLGFDEAVAGSIEHDAPSRLCAYLFDLASVFTSFYEACPVLRAPDEATRDSRLVLCELTARVLEVGLGLLGIDAPERM